MRKETYTRNEITPCRFLGERKPVMWKETYTSNKLVWPKKRKRISVAKVTRRNQPQHMKIYPHKNRICVDFFFFLHKRRAYVEKDFQKRPTIRIGTYTRTVDVFFEKTVKNTCICGKGLWKKMYEQSLRVADPLSKSCLGDPPTNSPILLRWWPFFEKFHTEMVRGSTARRP